MNLSTNGKIAHGALEVVAKQFGRNRSTVSRIWERACKTSLSGKLNVRSLSKNSGRPLKYDRVAVVEAIKDVPLRKRKKLRSLSNALGMPLGTIHRMMSEEIIRRHTAADGTSFYLGAGEPEPAIYTKHKRHITKVMCLCAVARPRMCPDSRSMWDGKIGIWPFAEWVPAKRSSKHRVAGTRGA